MAYGKDEIQNEEGNWFLARGLIFSVSGCFWFFQFKNHAIFPLSPCHYSVPDKSSLCSVALSVLHMAKAGLCSTPITIPHYGGGGGGGGLESGNHVVRPSLGHVVRTSLGRR